MAVPCIYPPITIGGRRYVDGGLRSSTNADLARAAFQHRSHLLRRRCGDLTGMRVRRQALEGEIDGLRRGGSTVELIEPDGASLRAFGPNAMDSSMSPDAAEAGVRQAKAEAPRIRTLWA
jgi:NTE family protein